MMEPTPSYLRLRQIGLATDDLPQAARDLQSIFGLACAHEDPQVEIYGIRNALFPVGLSFIELIAPLRPDTAAARFLQRGPQRGAYMAIFNCSDPHRRRAHVAALGLRIAAEITLDGFYGIQIHPRDSRAAMVELDHTPGEADLHGPYFAAGGSGWASAIRTENVRGLPAVVLESPTPQTLAEHWATLLERPLSSADGEPAITVDLCRIHVRPGPVEALRTVVLAVRDAATLLDRAARRGYSVRGHAIQDFCGVNMILTESPDT